MTERDRQVFYGLLFYIGDFLGGAFGINPAIGGGLGLVQWLRDTVNDFGDGKLPANSLDVLDAVLPE